MKYHSTPSYLCTMNTSKLLVGWCYSWWWWWLLWFLLAHSLPALYGHYLTENMPAPHKKYTTVTWPTPLLPCNNCPACPALAVNIVLTARNSGKYLKLYVENISELFHDYKILFFLLVWYLPWNCFHFLAVSWVNNKMFSIWTEIFWC